MIVLVLTAEGLQVGGIVPLARIRLFGKGRKGPSDRDLVEGAQFEASTRPRKPRCSSTSQAIIEPSRPGSVAMMTRSTPSSACLIASTFGLWDWPERLVP
jgi:hypothetical protein